MSKPWSEKPLWERVWLGPFSRVYLNVGKLVGHLGSGGFAFWDAAKLLPGYDKLRYDNALRDLTIYEKRERGEYELHASAKKILRVILGPAPDDPEYVSWWRGRLISVEQMRRDGEAGEWGGAPPLPPPAGKPAPEKPAEEPVKKKPARKPQKKPEAKEPARKKPQEKKPRKKAAGK